MNEIQPQLPKGFSVLQTQVAGHVFAPNTAALGMLKDEAVGGFVLKPTGKPDCGARELAFYESIQNTKDPGLMVARKFVPTFHKKIKLEVNSSEHTFLQLEDLTHGMLKPCIMDIKVGKRTWDPLSSPHKREVEEQKYTLCKQVLGLCLPGFQVYTDNECNKYGKDFGKQLDAKGLREAIAMFLNAQHIVYKPLIRELLRQLYDIRVWFKEQRYLHFYASSLLIVYDYDILKAKQNAQQSCCITCQIKPTSNGNLNSHFSDFENMDSLKKSQISMHKDCECKCQQTYVKVKMIDFAHVFPANNGSIDANYLFGLESLIVILEELLQR